MLWDKYCYHLRFTDKETEAQRGKQAVQGNQVTELGLNPGSPAPEIALNHSMLCWLVDGMNARMLNFFLMYFG